MIFFVFIFIIAVVNSAKKAELRGEWEKVVTKTLQKEGFRIYVEDCLEDGLEETLFLLGKQGRKVPAFVKIVSKLFK